MANTITLYITLCFIGLFYGALRENSKVEKFFGDVINGSLLLAFTLVILGCARAAAGHLLNMIF